MSYIANHLLSNEKIFARTHLHWIVFIFPLAWLLLYFVMYHLDVYIKTLIVPQILFLIPLVLFIGDSVRTYIRYKTTEFAVTNKRLVIKIGFFRCITSEFFLQKIENIQMQQTFVGKFLGYGTLIVHGTGGTQTSFFLMDEPVKFFMKVQEQVEQGASGI